MTFVAFTGPTTARAQYPGPAISALYLSCVRKSEQVLLASAGVVTHRSRRSSAATFRDRPRCRKSFACLCKLHHLPPGVWEATERTAVASLVTMASFGPLCLDFDRANQHLKPSARTHNPLYRLPSIRAKRYEQASYTPSPHHERKRSSQVRRAVRPPRALRLRSADRSHDTDGIKIERGARLCYCERLLAGFEELSDLVCDGGESGRAEVGRHDRS